MADSSIDNVFKKLETDIADLQAKKAGLESEVNTLTSIKDTASQEVARLQELQKQEEIKLGQFKGQTVQVEQESIQRLASEKESLETKRAESATALEVLKAKEEDLAAREDMVKRTTDTNMERANALTAQAADLDAREKQVTADREELRTRQTSVDTLAAEVANKQNDLVQKSEDLQKEKDGLAGVRDSMEKKSQEINEQREQANNLQHTAEAATATAREAKAKMEQFYKLTREVAVKVAVGVSAKDQDGVEAALQAWYAEIGYTPQSAA